jgi:hypothetical protein
MNRIILCLALSITLATSGCEQYQKIKDALTTATTYKTTSETADQVIIRSEQLTKESLLTFDTFLFIERNNEAALKNINPNIHVVAEKIRAHGQDWLMAARRTTKAFKENRTASNEADMKTAYATLLQAYNEVKSAKAQADSLTTKTP